jgi:hypothetical protein
MKYIATPHEQVLPTSRRRRKLAAFSDGREEIIYWSCSSSVYIRMVTGSNLGWDIDCFD